MLQLELELRIAAGYREMGPSILCWMLIGRGWKSPATTELLARPEDYPDDTGSFHTGYTTYRDVYTFVLSS